MASKKVVSGTNGSDVVVDGDKPNSRVTKKHIEQMIDAMYMATDETEPVSQRLGYLSFAIAQVLKDVGYPEHYKAISRKMWANYGIKTE